MSWYFWVVWLERGIDVIWDMSPNGDYETLAFFFSPLLLPFLMGHHRLKTMGQPILV
jgi:hypothetical protein